MTKTAAIAARGLSAGYHGAAAVRDIELEVHAGEVVLLAGANGAGKTTTLMTLAGALRPLTGHTELRGRRCAEPVHRRVRAGVGVVTEKRVVFNQLTVAENLTLGRGDTATALAHFPELEKRLGVKAGLLSGGEQQMLSLARVLAAGPSVILADELSLGLAPIVVNRLLAALRAAADAGAAVLLVEQHVRLALDTADRACFLQRGQLALAGTTDAIKQDPSRMEAIYL
ncbi:ABC transporter ATP-binding protein [Nocardioides sp. DS6]|uniref:ABC transporter ATP-binding protein n=1 Tax=Nocardioides eburneus TaxID=3231482 RepID=A0ABV3T3A7_9ACTN